MGAAPGKGRLTADPSALGTAPSLAQLAESTLLMFRGSAAAGAAVAALVESFSWVSGRSVQHRPATDFLDGCAG